MFSLLLFVLYCFNFIESYSICITVIFHVPGTPLSSLHELLWIINLIHTIYDVGGIIIIPILWKRKLRFREVSNYLRSMELVSSAAKSES